MVRFALDPLIPRFHRHSMDPQESVQVRPLVSLTKSLSLCSTDRTLLPSIHQVA